MQQAHPSCVHGASHCACILACQFKQVCDAGTSSKLFREPAFTDRQFNYQLTAEEARRLCDMFSKSATKRLYQFSTVAQPVLRLQNSAISSVMHYMSFQCSVRPAQALTLHHWPSRYLYLCLHMWNVGMMQSGQCHLTTTWQFLV